MRSKDERVGGASGQKCGGGGVSLSIACLKRSSWEADDRMVFGNLRVAWSVLFPMDDRSRKEGFAFQKASSFIYITYFHHRALSKGGGLFRFPVSLASFFISLTMYLFPERRSSFGAAFAENV